MDIDGVALLARVETPSSREDRPRVGWRLESLFADWNRDLRHQLLARFQLTGSGEEFGSILQPDADIGEIVLLIWKATHPVRINVTLARGTVTTYGRFTENPDEPLPGVHRFEGPALTVANKAQADLHASPYFITARVDGKETGRHMREFGTQLYLRFLEWTSRQLEIYESTRQSTSQAETARALNVSQPAVSQTLSRIDAPATRAGEEHFVQLARSALKRREPSGIVSA